MAGLLAYEGSDLPDSVKQAAQNYLDYQKAIKNKLPLAVEGSGVPDSVRKAAQSALENGYDISGRGAQAAAPAAAEVAADAAPGLLSRVGGAAATAGKFLGSAPVTGAQALTYSGDAGDGSDQLTPAQREANYPGSAADAQAYAQHIQDLTKQAIPQPQGPQGAGLLQTGAPQAAPQPAPTQAPTKDFQPERAPVTVSTDTPQINTAQAAQAINTRRQQIEQVATKQLQDNTLSRTKAAEQVVAADLQRAGVTPTPDQHKELVQKEVADMRSMDVPTLGKYLSYALVGLGVAAAVTDKTGGAASAFANAGLKAYQTEKAQQLATQKFIAEYGLKAQDQLRKNKQTDSTIQHNTNQDTLGFGKLDLDTKNVGSQIDTRAAQVKQGDRKLDQGDRAGDQKDIGLMLDSRKVAQGDVGLSLQARGLAQKDIGLGYEGDRIGIMSDAQKTNQQRADTQASRVAAQNAKDAAKAAAGTPIKADEGNTKDTQAFVNSWAKANNVKLDSGVLEAVSNQFQIARKNSPAAVAANPDLVMKKILANQVNGKPVYSQSVDKHWIGSDGTKFSLPGLLQQ